MCVVDELEKVLSEDTVMQTTGAIECYGLTFFTLVDPKAEYWKLPSVMLLNRIKKLPHEIVTRKRGSFLYPKITVIICKSLREVKELPTTAIAVFDVRDVKRFKILPMNTLDPVIPAWAKHVPSGVYVGNVYKRRTLISVARNLRALFSKPMPVTVFPSNALPGHFFDRSYGLC
jgi:hypothetical protein